VCYIASVDLPPDQIAEFANEAARYIRAALKFDVDYAGDTLPVVDYYLRTIPRDEPAALRLVIVTSGAYFGEVVRRHLGGRWHVDDGEPGRWRLTLPTGLSFSPPGVVAATIARSDELKDFDSSIDVPPELHQVIENTLARMSEVTTDEYYSLCGRFDTLEHLQEVVLAVALRRLERQTE